MSSTPNPATLFSYDTITAQGRRLSADLGAKKLHSTGRSRNMVVGLVDVAVTTSSSGVAVIPHIDGSSGPALADIESIHFTGFHFGSKSLDLGVRQTTR